MKQKATANEVAVVKEAAKIDYTLYKAGDRDDGVRCNCARGKGQG